MIQTCQSKFLIISLYLYMVMPLMAQVAQIELDSSGNGVNVWKIGI